MAERGSVGIGSWRWGEPPCELTAPAAVPRRSPPGWPARRAVRPLWLADRWSIPAGADVRGVKCPLTTCCDRRPAWRPSQSRTSPRQVMSDTRRLPIGGQPQQCLVAGRRAMNVAGSAPTAVPTPAPTRRRGHQERHRRHNSSCTSRPSEGTARPSASSTREPSAGGPTPTTRELRPRRGEPTTAAGCRTRRRRRCPGT